MMRIVDKMKWNQRFPENRNKFFAFHINGRSFIWGEWAFIHLALWWITWTFQTSFLIALKGETADCSTHLRSDWSSRKWAVSLRSLKPTERVFNLTINSNLPFPPRTIIIPTRDTEKNLIRTCELPPNKVIPLTFLSFDITGYFFPYCIIHVPPSVCLIRKFSRVYISFEHFLSAISFLVELAEELLRARNLVTSFFCLSFLRRGERLLTALGAKFHIFEKRELDLATRAELQLQPKSVSWTYDLTLLEKMMIYGRNIYS